MLRRFGQYCLPVGTSTTSSSSLNNTRNISSNNNTKGAAASSTVGAPSALASASAGAGAIGGTALSSCSSVITSARSYATSADPPTNTKPTVVVIGTGWAGARFVKDLDPKYCNIAVLSQRNHMIFTPLLPQTTTGTLEFRSICEPVVRIQPALAQLPNCFYRTMVYDVDFDQKVVQCVSVGVLGAGSNIPVKTFDFHYDKLVLAHGARPNTFNIPGVEDHAFFLREISEARGIRRRLIQNIMFANLPTTDMEEKKRLLHVVVVGGGPTGVEFAADLADFLHRDIPKIDPSLLKFFKLTLVEANEVLGTFDLAVRNYGAARLEKLGVKIHKAVVKEVKEENVTLTNGEVLTCGLVVWSTGVGPSSLTKQLKCDKAQGGRIAVNGRLQVLKDGHPIRDVYAIGDAAANITKPLPTLAAVASRQGTYLAKKVNAQIKQIPGPHGRDFEYKHLGSMVSLGSGSAAVEFQSPGRFNFKGIRAFFIWRSAYFTMLGSVRSRMYVMVNWVGTFIFGRDVTYIAEISEAKMWKSLAKEGASKEQTRRGLLKQAEERRSKHQMEPLTAKGLAEEKWKEEAAFVAEEKRKEEAAFVAEEKRKEEAAFVAEEKRKEEAAFVAEEKRKEEAAFVAEEKRKEEPALVAEEVKRKQEK